MRAPEVRLPIIFFFNNTATTEIYTLSLHDALPIWGEKVRCASIGHDAECVATTADLDRKSTRLNSSHITISYAVFCLKKKIRLARQDVPHPQGRHRARGRRGRHSLDDAEGRDRRHL